VQDLKDKKVIDKDGKIKDTMKAQLAAGTLSLSDRFSQAAQRAVVQALSKADNKVPLRDASKEITVKLNKQVMLSPQFNELWNKIKQKTTYRLNIDRETLINDAVKELKDMPQLAKARIATQTADILVKKQGVSHNERDTKTIDLEETYQVLPDIIRLISTETHLKRRTVGDIIIKSGRGQDFLNNPQGFYEKALEIIRRNRHSLAIDGISYQRLAGQEYYIQQIFDNEELIANLERNAVAVNHSVYNHIIYDSNVESEFATDLDKDSDVKLFIKLPSKFKVDTPIGTYNPDWAVLLEKNNSQKLYFVLETKGTTNLFDITPNEKLKIRCGERHFEALGKVTFHKEPVKSWKEYKRDFV
jgi:type III restriction enzyme